MLKRVAQWLGLYKRGLGTRIANCVSKMKTEGEESILLVFYKLLV